MKFSRHYSVSDNFRRLEARIHFIFQFVEWDMKYLSNTVRGGVLCCASGGLNDNGHRILCRRALRWTKFFTSGSIDWRCWGIDNKYCI